MYLSPQEARLLADTFAVLAEEADEMVLRTRLGECLLRLLHADQFASYVWDADAGRFDRQVSIAMEPSNLARYRAWYQFRDPITFALQARRHATCVSEIMPRADFLRSEFYNDFLARDGLHWGINLHLFDGALPLGDLRIWRGRGGQDFDERDKAMLELMAPALRAALRRQGADTHGAESSDARLSAREQAVARHIAAGLTDKQIALALGIALPSVRTYIRRLFDKLGVRRRAGLAQALARLEGPDADAQTAQLPCRTGPTVGATGARRAE